MKTEYYFTVLLTVGKKTDFSFDVKVDSNPLCMIVLCWVLLSCEELY